MAPAAPAPIAPTSSSMNDIIARATTPWSKPAAAVRYNEPTKK